MAAPPPRPRAEGRRRARRGSSERPVSGRIYRATWALVALPLLIAAFTVGRPAALPPPALPASFDQAAATQIALDFGNENAIRTPGTSGAARATAWVKARLAAYNLTVREEPFFAQIPGRGRVRMINLVASPLAIGPRRSSDAIVVMAHRDNTGLSPGLDDDASGTAALIELARDLSTVSLTHRVLFVSTDGGSFGNLGAARLAADPAFRRSVVAVVNLDAIAGPGHPRLEFAGDAPRSPSSELLTTADQAIQDQAGSAADHPSALAQLLDLAFPFSLYDQAPFVAAGVSGITFTSSGDRPPTPDADTAAAFDPTHLGTIGRSAQALIGSLDTAAEVTRGAESYVYLGGRFIRGFAIEFLLVVAMLPVLLATIDLAARLRRRGMTFGPALRSYRSRLAVWSWAGLGAVALSFLGAFPNAGERPLSPDTPQAQDWPFGALIVLALLSGGGWLAARPRLLPRAAVSREEELAGHLVLMVALSVLSVAIAIANPFALIFVLPALHAWLWIPHLRDSRLGTRLAVYSIGFAGPIVYLVSFALRFRTGWDTPWYVTTLFSVGYAPILLFVAFLVCGACAGQAGAILFGRYSPYPPAEERPQRGPVREGVRRLVLYSRARTARRSAEREEPNSVAGRDLPVAPGHVDEGVGLRRGHDHV